MRQWIMLSIRKLFFSLSILYSVLLLASLMFTRWVWFYPAELQTQLEQQQHQLYSLTTVFNLMTSQLNNQAVNHAEWLASYLTNQPDHTIEKTPNITKQVTGVLPSNISLAFAIDNQQKPLYALIRQQNLFSNYATPEHLKPLLKQLGNSQHSDNEVPTNFIRLDDQLYVYAMSPIPAAANGAARGWVGVLQSVSDITWSALAKISQINLEYLDSKQIKQPTSLFAPLHEGKIQRQRCLLDANQQPLQCFKLTHQQQHIPKFLDGKSILIFCAIVFVPIILFSIFLGQVLRPIYKTMDLLRQFQQQNVLKPITYKYWLPIKELREFKEIYNQVISMALRQQQQLELLSNTDKLTNIPNRRAFDDNFINTWNRLKRHPLSVALVMIDIDFFKLYNDFYGHQQGDKALQLVASALANCARRTDELAARYGGEEFVLIVFIENDFEMEQFQQRLQQGIRKLKIEHQKSTVDEQLTVSAGIAWIQNSGRWIENFLADDWLKAADDALYRAKSTGRNKHEVIVINESQPFI